MKRIVVTFVLCAALAACNREDRSDGPPPAPPQASQGPAAPQPTEMPKVDQNAILERIKVLSSDEYEGRKPGTKGEDLTVRYLVEESKKLGLQPGNPDAPTCRKCRSSASRAPRRSR